MSNVRPLGQVAASLAALVFAALVFQGCSGDVHNRIVTTANINQARNDVQNAQNLTDEDKRAFIAAVNRSDFQPYGKTVSQIIAEQNKYEAERAAAAERAAKLKAQNVAALDHDLIISPKAIDVVKQYYPYGGIEKGPYEDQDTLYFTVTNRGKKYVQSFSATATLANQGGDSLFSGTLEDFNLAPGETHTFAVHVSGITGGFDPQLVRTTPVEDTAVNYSVDEIRYADGTTISRSN